MSDLIYSSTSSFFSKVCAYPQSIPVFMRLPVMTWCGLNPVVSFDTVHLKDIWIGSNNVGHECWSFRWRRNAAKIALFTTSDFPLDFWLKIDVLSFFIWKSFAIWDITSPVRLDAASKIIVFGIPYRAIYDTIFSAISEDFWVLSGYSSTHREKLSTMTKIYLYPSGDLGSAPIRSMCTVCPGSDTGRECMGAFFLA